MADLGSIGVTHSGPFQNDGLTVRRTLKAANCNIDGHFPSASRNNLEGDPAPPCLQLNAGRDYWRFRWIVETGARTISINVKQTENVSPRPTLVVKANPDIGVNADVTETAPSGTGWVTIGPAAINPTSDGAVWVEVWNNIDGILPCYFDNIQQT